MRVLVLVGLLAVSACGADGPPETPGTAVSGDARVGVVLR